MNIATVSWENQILFGQEAGQIYVSYSVKNILYGLNLWGGPSCYIINTVISIELQIFSGIKRR